MTSEAYARQLKQLLPRSTMWRLDSGGVLHGLLLAISEELARIDARALALIEETDPRTATETLDEWEAALGLSAEGTSAARRLAAAARYVAQGGQSPAYFVAVALQRGFVVTVAKVGPALWRMSVPLAQASAPYTVVDQVFRAGAGRAGDLLASRSVPELESAIRWAAPAHGLVYFAYTL